MKLALFVVGLVVMSVSEASADERKPFHPRLERVTAIEAQALAVRKIERERTLGRSSVLFSADSARVENGAVMLFEIHTTSGKGSELRWRCIAVSDISECFGDTVRIGWRAHDFNAVLTLSLEPIASRRGAALVAEANRRFPLLAAHP